VNTVSTESAQPQRRAIKVGLASLAVALSAGALFAWPGQLHPDEFFQALEPANRLAFGFGVKSWEWQVGLRNWAVPGVMAALLRLAAAIGVENPWARRALMALPSVALYLASLLAVYRFAERRVGGRLAAWALVLFGTTPAIALVALRSLSESYSAAFLVLAFERLDASDRAPRVALQAGLAMGLAEVCRYGSAPFIVVTLIWLAREGRRRLVPFVAGGAAVAFLLGALDAATWGRTLDEPHLGGWWHSLIEYLTFNFIKGGASSFGRSPWWFYVPSFGVLWALLGVGVWRSEPRLRAALPFTATVVYLASIVAVPHKEERFLIPAIFVGSFAAMPGVVWLISRVTDRAWALAVAALAATSVGTWSLGDGLRPKGSELVVLTERASREGHGLLVVHAGLWGSAGSFYARGSNLMRLADDAQPTPSHRWCTADDVNDACFQVAVADPNVDRAIVIDPLDASTEAALRAAGFRRAGALESAYWFER